MGIQGLGTTAGIHVVNHGAPWNNVINGEALSTTASIRIAQFLADFLGSVLERADLVARERINEPSPGQAGNVGGTTLGKPTELIPLDGSGYAHLLRKLLGA